MRKNKYLKIVISTLLMSVTLFSFTGCSGSSGETDNSSKATYEQITAQEAKELMDTEKDYIILDTRTEEEFSLGHIENAIVIPHDEIAQRAEDELSNKEQLILVYCRSGNRSKQASQTLADLGYTNVKEFGGIIDWEYGIVE
ncbi:MAG: rhodanese-like domain-containing protein [Ruminococcus sp.]|nr:rhodanese-like domain-containing protein [Ruminococcus sp.]